MKITKFGHSCLLVEEGSARILIDPGIWSTIPENLSNLDVILITHEHGDHYSVDVIQQILKNNSKAVIYTNPSVHAKLAAQNIAAQILGSGARVVINGVTVEGIGEKHAFLYHTLPIVDNVGFIIAGKLFQPGDALTIPAKPVEILACPIAAPWMKIAEMLDYGLAVKPKIIFPIHDAFLKPSNPFYPHAEREFTAAGIQWLILQEGEVMEF